MSRILTIKKSASAYDIDNQGEFTLLIRDGEELFLSFKINLVIIFCQFFAR